MLAALTPAGVDRLRARWPAKRIELLPHGCPTWFPPRKAERGRVIGAFGFLEPHKGFWRLLDAVRSMPGTELVLYSYSKSPETTARWEQAARGLHVRHIDEFLPAAEIARRLAAEVDVLAFWYDEADIAAASGAARIGLATGVPVLTSPTGWFQDLQEVTFQPIELLTGVQRLLDDTPLRERLTAAAYEFCHAHSWAVLAERHRRLWQEIE